MTAQETLDWIYSLLGKPVLLPIPLGQKRPAITGWQKLTFSDQQNCRSDIIEAIERGGNLGVLLGPASDGLLALDLDDDGLVERWIAHHPWLADTLRTKGKRGCQFWLRLEPDCEYPNGKAVYLLDKDGHAAEAKNAVGELRLGGNGGAQSVIYGVHPDGMPYQVVVNKPPKVVSLANLNELAPGLIFPEEVFWEEESPTSQPTNNSAQNVPSNIPERVIRYIDKCKPAVSGEHGHDQTFKVLCEVIRGFDLSRDQAWQAAVYFNQKCQPPWSEKELRHKLDDALKATASQQRGHLLQSEHAKKEYGDKQETGGANGGEKPSLILPSGHVSITESATNLFNQLAKKRRYFARGRLVVEIVNNKQGSEVLSPLRANAFRSRIEEDFRLLSWRSPKGEPVLKPAYCPKDIAEAFLESNPAIDFLPGITLLVSCPILVECEGKLGVLNKGFHEENGGVYVERRIGITELAIKEATENILRLLSDFHFTSESDKSRAVANFISPALRFGGLLEGDFPLDLSEADESQAGKTYRQKLVCAIYGEAPYIIARRENGVGSLDESISGALISGRPFICFENVRGIMDSQILESALRGHGYVNARVPHRGEIQLSTTRICWQLSSNQGSTTRDLANRSVITRIRKRPAGHEYKTFPEGDLLAHVQRNCGLYLSSVFAVVQEWYKAGKPKTSDSRHDFREWSQPLDWIVQNLFGLPPLLDGHREEQARISDPYLNWLRDVAIAVSQAGKLDEGLRPAELVDLSVARGVSIPGRGPHGNEEGQQMLAGRILIKIFGDADTINVGGFQVRHDPRSEYDCSQRKEFARHYYWFENQR